MYRTLRSSKILKSQDGMQPMRIKSDEYAERMKRLKYSVRENGLDAFLVTAHESIYYLTGVTYVPLERPFFIIVRPDGVTQLLVPSLDREHLAVAPNVDKVFCYWDYPSPSGMGWHEKLAEMIYGVKSLGIEPSLTQEIAAVLSEFSPRVIPLVENLRLVKSPAEIEMLRIASRFADMGMEQIIRTAYSGVSEIEIFAGGRSVQMEIIKNADYDPLNTSVLAAAWPARLGTQPHGVPEVGDRLREGPHIALSFLRVNGYAAECERTFFVNPPTPSMKEMFDIMCQAREKAFSIIRPGVKCSDIDTAANGFLRDRGLGEYLLHRTGHGFGLGNHEGPGWRKGAWISWRRICLSALSPGIYIPGMGGFRHSDTVLVVKNGYESLTRFPADLKTLTLSSLKLLARLRGALIRKALKVK